MHRLATLSFAEKTDAGQMNLWISRNDLPWEAGNAEGRRRADELVACMQVHGAPNLLGFVAAAIVDKGSMSAIEIGFFTRVASFAMEGEVPLPATLGGRRPLSLVAGNDGG